MYWKRSALYSMLLKQALQVPIIPLPTPLWIQSYSVWQGSNQWESQVPSEIIILEKLLNMDDVKLNKYGPSVNIWLMCQIT